MRKRITVNKPKKYEVKDSEIFNSNLAYDLETLTPVKSIRYGIVCINGLVSNWNFTVVKNSILLHSEYKVPNRTYFVGEVFKKKVSFVNTEVPFIIAFSTWSINYFHWFTDTLTRLQLLDDQQTENAIILLPANFTSPFFKESLEMLGFNQVHYIELDEVQILKRVIIPPYTAKTGYFDPIILQRLAQKFTHSTKSDLQFPKKIYISRKKAEKRKVLNEDIFIPLLENEGFVALDFEDLSLQKQISIMKGATHLISLHGAGLTNMLFMPTGSNVLELRKFGENELNCYFTMASALGHSYYYLQCDPEFLNDNYTHLANVNVNVKELMSLVNDFIKI